MKRLILSVMVAVMSISAIGQVHNDHEYVDLGLPSGTLWATCNVGAINPEDYGSYFVWGETSPKEVYSKETYVDWSYYPRYGGTSVRPVCQP